MLVSSLVNRLALKSGAVALLGAVIVGVQLFRSPGESVMTFAIVATFWWFARMQLARRREHHLHRSKRARQVRRAVINSGVISAAIWLTIALLKASRDMGAEQGDELVSAWTAWPGLFLVDGLVVIVGLTYIMLAVCTILLLQPRTKRRRKIRSQPVDPAVATVSKADQSLRSG